MNALEAQQIADREGKTYFTGLDPSKLYSLGNMDYVCTGRCEFCGDQLKMRHGVNDGYNWAHPCCTHCGKDVETYEPLIEWAKKYQKAELTAMSINSMLGTMSL